MGSGSVGHGGGAQARLVGEHPPGHPIAQGGGHRPARPAARGGPGGQGTGKNQLKSPGQGIGPAQQHPAPGPQVEQGHGGHQGGGHPGDAPHPAHQDKTGQGGGDQSRTQPGQGEAGL